MTILRTVVRNTRYDCLPDNSIRLTSDVTDEEILLLWMRKAGECGMITYLSKNDKRREASEKHER